MNLTPKQVKEQGLPGNPRTEILKRIRKPIKLKQGRDGKFYGKTD
jgi:hypothetical protein